MNSNIMNKNQNRKLTFFAIIFVVLALCVGLLSAQLNLTLPADAEESGPVSVWDGSSDMSWFSHSTNTFTLTSAAQLRGLADMAINGFDFSPYTIKLGTNVDLNGLDWKPFKNYAGTFDGQGHYISNGKLVVSDSNGTGFFGVLNKVTYIKNLTFKNMDVRSKVLMCMAIVAGGNTADGTTFSNVNVKNCFVYGAPYRSGQYSGGNCGSDNYVAAFVPISTAAIKFENCGVYDTMISGGYKNGGIIAKVSGGAYKSKIVGCKIIDTFALCPLDSVGLFISNGIDSIDIENSCSNMYPTPIAFTGSVRAKFTQEQQDLYDDVLEAEGKIIYGYRDTNDDWGILNAVTLGTEDLTSNYLTKSAMCVSAAEANAFTVSTKTPCDITIAVDGVTTSENTASLTVNLTEGAHAISFNVSYDGTVCASGSVISGLDSMLKVYDSDSAEVVNSEQFITKEGFEIRVSGFKSGYTLKKTNDINGVTFKVNDTVLTADGAAFESKNGMYMTSVDVAFDGYETTLNYLIYTGVRVSADGTYPWTYIADGNYYKSTNQKKGSSQSDIVFTVFPGYKLSFDYACSSENNYDYLFFVVNGADAGNTKGANCTLATDAEVLADSSVWKTYEYENTSSEVVTVRAYYKKDSGGDKGSDTAYIRNISATAVSTASQASLAAYADESGSETTEITLPSDAIKLSDKVYYKYEGTKSLPYNQDKGWFVCNNDNNFNLENTSVTIYILNSDYFTFEYANCKGSVAEMSTACFDNETTINLYGAGKGSGYVDDSYFIEYTHKFDFVGTHKIQFVYTDSDGYYGWALRNIKAAVDVPLNVNVSVIGDGAAYDILGFNDALIDENYTKSVFSKLQLFAKPEVGSDYLYRGYRIMGSDGNYGDLIESNGDILTLGAEDFNIQIEFRRILPLENLEYTFNKDGVSESGTAYHYGTRVFNTPQENAEYILQASIVSGATVMITDSAVDGSITPEVDNGKYFYKITDFSKSHIVKFIYNKEGYGTTMLMTTLEYSPLIEEYLVSSESLPVTVINDDANFPFVYSEELSTTDKITYRSSLGKSNTHKMVSNVGLKVTGTGVLVFDYYVSTQRREARDDLKADSWLLWQKEFTGDKAMYGINTKVDYDSLTEAEIDSSLTDKVGYMGQELGSTDYYSTCTGKLGWKRATIPVSGGADEETIVYLAYVKDVDDVNGENDLSANVYDDSEDTFAIANVMFVSGDSTVTFSSNSSTATITASSDAEANITSGATIAAGSKVTFTVSNTDSSAKFIGWVNSDGTVLSHDATYSRYVTDDIEIKAMYANDTAAYFVEGNLFSTLNEAIESLKDGSVYRTATIVLYADSTITNDVVIPANVTLLLPFAADDESGLKLGDRIYDRVSWNRGINPFVTLTVSTGATLTVNGNLKIGAVQHTYEQTAQGMTSGDYAQLVNNGNVVLNGFMDVRGRVTGNGTLTVNNGATLKEPFLVNDFSGGTNTYELYTSGQFPFNQFATVNIECKQVVNYGGKVIGTTALYFWKSITTQDVVLVDKIENRSVANAVGSLIWMHDGSRLEITYDINKCVNRTYGTGAKGFTIHLGDSGLTTIDVYGEITAGEFSLQGYGSKSLALAIPYTYNFNVKNGAIVNVIQKYKIMPGAVVTVENGGTINISENGGLYVYDGLIQAVKDNKQYPQAAELAQYGFSKSGMLIVDGVLNIDGIFAGTIQTNGYGVINVGNGATVGEQTIVDGCSTGYQQTSSPNKTVFTMNGRVYGINGYVQLETGKTYKAFATDGFVYDTFSVISADRMSTLSVAMNQAMKGRFLEYDGNNYIADVTFDFPTELNGRIVVINGNNYEIVDGKVTVNGLVIGEDRKATYRMSEIESAEISHDYVVTTGENAFDKLALSVALSEENVYEKVFDANGGVVSDYVLKAVITYSDGSVVSYDLTFDAFTTYVKENAAFTSEYISSEAALVHTLTVVKQELVAYIATAEALNGSEDIVTDAKNAYAEYRTLTAGLSATELAFVNGKIGALQDYAKSIVIGIALKNGVVATYGDAETTANATMIDGSNKDVTVSLSGYALANGGITVNATYAGKYLNLDYTANAVFGGIARKDVVLTVTGDGEYVYDGTERKVTVTVNGVLGDDEITVEGFGATDAGSKTVTFVLGGANAAFYKISDTSVASATVTITAKEVELVWTGSEFTYNGSEQKPEVRFADGEIVDGDEVTLFVSGNVNAGEYIAIAVATGSKSANYSLKNPSFAYTIAKKPVTVKVADHNDVSENETSRILFTAVCEDDLGGYSFIITKDGVEVATVATDGTVTLKDGQTLSVGTYKVKAVSDNANYEVTSEENEFNVVEPNAYYTVDFGVSEDGKTYDGNATVFNVTAKITDTNEVVNEIVVTITKDGVVVDGVVAAGSYTVTAKVGSDEVVYTKVFVVNKRTLTVAIDDINTVYGTPAEVSSKLTDGEIVDGDENVYSVAVDGAHANAGEYRIVGTVTNGNYAVTFVSSKSADRNYGIYTVAKKNVTLVWTGSEFTYNGSKQSPEAKLSEGSVVGDDELTVSVSDGNTDKGDYVATATLGGAVKDNYELANATYAYAINARSITLNVADAESVYGDELSEIKVTPEDANELCGVLVNEIVRIKCAVSKTSAAGKYDITLEVINGNFVVNYEKGTYTVNKREITVTVAAASSIYGDALATISGEVTEGSIVNGDENVYTLSKKGESLDKGEYEVVLTVTNDSYIVNISNESVRYTITARAITVNVSDVTMTYGDTAAGFDCSLAEGSSLGYSDNLNDVINVSRETGDDAGRYAITASGASDNYIVSFVYTDRANGRSYYVIEKREITIKVNDVEVDSKKTYDQVVAEFGYEVVAGSIVGDDTLNVTYAIYFGDRQATADNYATLVRGGTHTVKATAVNANYEITVNDGVFTVTKPKITVKNIGTSFVYDDGKQIKAFDWQKNIEGFLASATENSVVASFRKLVNGVAEGEPTMAVTDAGTYRMTIVILHTDAYAFDENAVTEYDITVAKKDISSDIVVVGRNESGTYVQRRGIQIYAKLNEYEDKDLSLNSTLTFNGEAVESPYEVGAYVFTAVIDDANYCGETVYSFRIMASVAKKIGDLSALIEEYNEEGTSSERFDAIMAMREITASFTEDDLTQIAEDAAYTDVVNQYVTLYKNYLNDTKSDVEVARKVASNVLFDIMAALTDIAVAFWFGKANRG